LLEVPASCRIVAAGVNSLSIAALYRTATFDANASNALQSKDDVCKEPGMNTIARFANDESGATAIEYGLIAALIAVGIIAAATTLGGNLSSLFQRISGHLSTAS
jgi:pilus assembly protein Flp/PilA